MPTDLRGRTVVVLHAHPDDESLFTGATLAALTGRGARVVVVMATAGDLGVPLVPLPDGTGVAAYRLAELEEACARLGVSRLVPLGRRDSGLPGWDANHHPDALVRADAAALARRVTEILEEERAEALVHYDGDGITGHLDHLVIHEVGTLAATRAGVTSYQATIDREHLHFTGPHLAYGGALRDLRGSGRVTAEITTAVAATPELLAAKRSALAAHRSQIPAETLDAPWFAEAYGLEWYLRTGPAGILEQLGNAHAAAGPGAVAPPEYAVPA